MPFSILFRECTWGEPGNEATRPSEAGRQGRPGPPHFSSQFFFFSAGLSTSRGREQGARCYELRTLSRSYITACIGKWVRTTLSKWLRFACSPATAKPKWRIVQGDHSTFYSSQRDGFFFETYVWYGVQAV